MLPRRGLVHQGGNALRRQRHRERIPTHGHGRLLLKRCSRRRPVRRQARHRAARRVDRRRQGHVRGVLVHQHHHGLVVGGARGRAERRNTHALLRQCCRVVAHVAGADEVRKVLQADAEVGGLVVRADQAGRLGVVGVDQPPVDVRVVLPQRKAVVDLLCNGNRIINAGLPRRLVVGLVHRIQEVLGHPDVLAQPPGRRRIRGHAAVQVAANDRDVGGRIGIAQQRVRRGLRKVERFRGHQLGRGAGHGCRALGGSPGAHFVGAPEAGFVGRRVPVRFVLQGYGVEPHVARGGIADVAVQVLGVVGVARRVKAPAVERVAAGGVDDLHAGRRRPWRCKDEGAACLGGGAVLKLGCPLRGVGCLRCGVPLGRCDAQPQDGQAKAVGQAGAEQRVQAVVRHLAVVPGRRSAEPLDGLFRAAKVDGGGRSGGLDGQRRADQGRAVVHAVPRYERRLQDHAAGRAGGGGTQRCAIGRGVRGWVHRPPDSVQRIGRGGDLRRRQR